MIMPAILAIDAHSVLLSKTSGDFLIDFAVYVNCHVYQTKKISFIVISFQSKAENNVNSSFYPNVFEHADGGSFSRFGRYTQCQPSE